MAATTKKPRARTKTLAAIEQDMGALRERVLEHEKGDEKVAAEFRRQIVGLARKDDLNELRSLLVGPDGKLLVATRSDIDSVLELFSNVKTAGVVISGIGRWAWKILLGVAMFIAILGVIKGGVKEALHYVAAAALGGH